MVQAACHTHLRRPDQWCDCLAVQTIAIPIEWNASFMRSPLGNNIRAEYALSYPISGTSKPDIKKKKQLKIKTPLKFTCLKNEEPLSTQFPNRFMAHIDGNELPEIK